MSEVKVIRHVWSPENGPDCPHYYFEVEVGGESLVVEVDDARKLRDALCIMLGVPEPKRKRAK